MVIIPVVLASVIIATGWDIISYKSGTMDYMDVTVNVGMMVIIALVIRDLWVYAIKKEKENNNLK